jgi:DNA-binding NtrC family response regulator
MAKVLLVDDEMTMVQMVTELLRSEGHQVIPFTNASSATEALAKLAPELVLANLSTERARSSGLAVLQKSRTLHPPPVTIMITARGSLEAALEAMRKGAYDYLDKPFTLDELKLRVQRALAHHAAISENVHLRKQLQSKYQLREIIGSSPLMLQVLKLIERVAEADSSVIITGPTGSGKELVARAIHFNSRRRFAPFLVVSCGLLPDHLLESHLFGSQKTPLTASSADTPGLFEEANGGTVLLDGVGALSTAMQGRLLRILQDREVRRIGGDSSMPLDIRILAATDENLERKVAASRFREDFYAGLNVVSIFLPSLSERSEDIPQLVSHFLESKIHRQSNSGFTLVPEALEACCRYGWPGNVRELENVIERACALSKDGVIRLSDLSGSVQRAAPVREGGQHPDPDVDPHRGSNGHAPRSTERPVTFLDEPLASPPGELVPLKQFIRSQELTYLHRTLAQVGGSKEKAAELLGISLATIYRKLAEDSVFGAPVETAEPVAPYPV